jgi:hypothetical protein
MALAEVIGVVFLAVLFAWLAMVFWGVKRSIDIDLDAERRG